MILNADYAAAVVELLDYQSFDSDYQLPQNELRLLSNGLFQARDADEAVPLLEEYIQRFPHDCDRQRVKLAVLFVKLQQRPTAALKHLAKVNPKSQGDDYREIHLKTARYAQQMISDGVVDAG